jgi:NAD+ diphosphatase
MIAPAAAERSVWLYVHKDGLVVAPTEAGGARLPVDDELPASLLAPATAPDYLGELDGAHAFAVAVDDAPPWPFTVRNLRQLYGALDDDAFAVAGRAVQLAHWATTHRYCGRCATATVRVAGERAMRCAACRLDFYPRISPAIIVLVRRGDAALLARNARFPLPFYSTLAGFCEAGESLEETLVREVKEEAGIDVGAIRYFGSQPWPFPHSLMVGFFAEYVGGELRADANEIVDAQWWTVDKLPPVPPRISIARQLIDSWIEDVRGKE